MGLRKGPFASDFETIRKRRAEVEKLLTECKGVYEIVWNVSDQFGCSKDTIYRDIRKIKAGWKREIIVGKEEQREEFLKQLDRAIVKASADHAHAAVSVNLKMKADILRLFEVDPNEQFLKPACSFDKFLQREFPKFHPVPSHLRIIEDLFERSIKEPTFAVISMPPRHGKTVTLTNALSWAISEHPNLQCAYVTYAKQPAETVSRKVRSFVEKRVKISEQNTLAYWLASNGSGLAATGALGQLTGKGFNGPIVYDDPFKGRVEAESLHMRDRVWETFTSDVFTRREPPNGSVIVVHTRWHDDDLAGRLISGKFEDSGVKWEVVNLPAISEEDSALWPERYSLEELRSIREFVGSYTWASLYQGTPQPRGGHVFGVPTYYESPETNGVRYIIGVDCAGTASEKSDYSVAVVLAVWGQGREKRADVVEVIRVQERPEKFAERLRELQSRYSGAPIRIESSRDGNEVKKILESSVKGLRLTGVAAVGDKFVRSIGVSAAWSAGRIRVPKNEKWVPAFVSELSQFTGVSDPHDDQVDALAYAWGVRPNSEATGTEYDVF